MEEIYIKENPKFYILAKKPIWNTHLLNAIKIKNITLNSKKHIFRSLIHSIFEAYDHSGLWHAWTKLLYSVTMHLKIEELSSATFLN